MYKVAVIGDRDSIYGFESAGLEIFPILTDEEALKNLDALIESNYAVIYMPESLFNSLDSKLAEYETLTIPAIIPIPGISGNTGVGLSRVRKFVERAVGSDILFGDDALENARINGKEGID